MKVGKATWSFSFIEKEQVLSARVEGDFGIEDLREMSKEFYPEAAKHSCVRFLFDYRQAQAHASVLEILQRADELPKLGIRYGSKIAVVGMPDFRYKTFYETAMANRGYKAKFFDSPEQAIQWLTT